MGEARASCIANIFQLKLRMQERSLHWGSCYEISTLRPRPASSSTVRVITWHVRVMFNEFSGSVATCPRLLERRLRCYLGFRAT